MSFSAGETVGPYRIIEQLGQGGMASVFKAYHASLDRFVALKVLHPAFMEDSNFLARFQREARLVAKLDHPSIVPIYDYSEHEGRPYLVMKYIEGETLKARLVRGRITAEETARIVQAVGEALSYAHKQGILHRDIKPSNVLLAKDGGIYLADFGLARIAASGESTLSTDMVMGTPQYISPEQALGKRDLDEGTDIYSFGVMLYELIVGKVPFSADTPFSIIHDHIYSPLPMPRQVNPQVSPDVERVLLKALAKERQDRYPDIDSMVAAFKGVWQERLPSQPIEQVLPSETPTLVPAPIPIAPPPPAEISPIPPSPAAASPVVPGAAAVSPVPRPTAEAILPPPVPAGQENRIKPKRKFPWMWLAVGVILVLGCLISLAALSAYRRTAGSATPPPPAQANPLLQPATLSPLNAATPRVVAATTAGVAGTPPAAMDLKGAQQQAAQRPNDPIAQLQLATAYYAAGNKELAEKQVTVLEKLLKTEASLLDAGQKFADQGAWLISARLRVDAAEMHLVSSKALPARMTDLLHRTIYQASADADMPTYLPFDRIAKIDDKLATLARARYTFYFKDQKQGQNLLNQLKQASPIMPEAQLLQAEIDAKLGQYDAARQALTELSKNPAETDWMRAAAESIKGALH